MADEPIVTGDSPAAPVPLAPAPEAVPTTPHACGPRCWPVSDWIALLAMLDLTFIVAFCCFLVPAYWGPIEQVVAFFLGVVSGATASHFTSLKPGTPSGAPPHP